MVKVSYQCRSQQPWPKGQRSTRMVSTRMVKVSYRSLAKKTAALAKKTKVNQNGKGFLSKEIPAALAKMTKVNQNGKGFLSKQPWPKRQQPWPKKQRSIIMEKFFFIKADLSSLGQKEKGQPEWYWFLMKEKRSTRMEKVSYQSRSQQPWPKGQRLTRIVKISYQSRSQQPWPNGQSQPEW